MCFFFGQLPNTTNLCFCSFFFSKWKLRWLTDGRGVTPTVGVKQCFCHNITIVVSFTFILFSFVFVLYYLLFTSLTGMDIVCLLTTTASRSSVKSVQEHTITKKSRTFVHALGRITLMRCRANKKKSKIKQNCWTRNVKFLVNFQYKGFNIDRVLSCSTIVSIPAVKKRFVKGCFAYNIQLPIPNPETNR